MSKNEASLAPSFPGLCHIQFYNVGLGEASSCTYSFFSPSSLQSAAVYSYVLQGRQSVV